MQGSCGACGPSYRLLIAGNSARGLRGRFGDVLTEQPWTNLKLEPVHETCKKVPASILAFTGAFKRLSAAPANDDPTRPMPAPTAAA